eukprot:IDg16057t1
MRVSDRAFASDRGLAAVASACVNLKFSAAMRQTMRNRNNMQRATGRTKGVSEVVGTESYQYVNVQESLPRMLAKDYDQLPCSSAMNPSKPAQCERHLGKWHESKGHISGSAG